MTSNKLRMMFYNMHATCVSVDKNNLEIYSSINVSRCPLMFRDIEYMHF